MKLYAITDASQLPGSPEDALNTLVALARIWAAFGVDYIQIREKTLTSRALESLAVRIMEAMRPLHGISVPAKTKVLVNGRADVALAVGADGVHLPSSGAMTPREVATLFDAAGREPPVISVSCHSIREIEAARDAGATVALFAPVFVKTLRSAESVRLVPGAGLAGLDKACQAARLMPVFALGGVTMEDGASCVEAGAIGVAGIRLFQSPPWITEVLVRPRKAL
jgi:thiamine-phosphate pyrophosphorylase